jgi:hypothetical protein
MIGTKEPSGGQHGITTAVVLLAWGIASKTGPFCVQGGISVKQIYLAIRPASVATRANRIRSTKPQLRRPVSGGQGGTSAALSTEQTELVATEQQTNKMQAPQVPGCRNPMTAKRLTGLKSPILEAVS